LNVPLDWENIEERSLTVLHGKNIQACLGSLCLGATVYNLWRQKNDLMHNNTPRTEEPILAHIKWEIRAKILAKRHFNSL
jgi:hypothetical protein